MSLRLIALDRFDHYRSFRTAMTTLAFNVYPLNGSRLAVHTEIRQLIVAADAVRNTPFQDDVHAVERRVRTAEANTVPEASAVLD